MSIYGERVARLEEQVSRLKIEVREMNDKLDELLNLKNKGTGAFWLAGLIISSGLIGFGLQLFTWFKGGNN